MSERCHARFHWLLASRPVWMTLQVERAEPLPPEPEKEGNHNYTPVPSYYKQLPN